MYWRAYDFGQGRTYPCLLGVFFLAVCQNGGDCGGGGVDCWPCLGGSESAGTSMQNGRQLVYAPLMWPFYEF